VVLIDTAGRSPRDGGRLNELGGILAAAAPDETHLVLSSTASESAMLEAANRFASIGTSRVIFTKLDEAVTFGVIFNVAQQVGTQLSFITTGQEVPDQIEATRPERLARLMLGSL
jgi:flagellar biosynthesis protein FlhF